MTKKISNGLMVLYCVVSIVLGTIVGFFTQYYVFSPKGGDVYVSGDLSFHFLELGNKYAGDCIYIKAGDVDILIDAGSRTNSINTICNYIDNYVLDGKLEYVIVTHAHQDHYAGFTIRDGSIFDRYQVDTIIDFARTDNESTRLYQNYVAERAEAIQRGAKHYTALDCINKTNGAVDTFNIYGTIQMQILNSKFYTQKSSDENNYSVVTLFSQGDNHFLLTGDLEKDGEKSIVELNNLPKVQLYKAGHHGSKTSSTDALLSVIRPEIVVATCCAGATEYTSITENTFPTQIAIDNVSKYTDKFYVTTQCVDYENGVFQSMNGNIVVSDWHGRISVNCSNNNTLLKDTVWMRENRVMPTTWLSA